MTDQKMPNVNLDKLKQEVDESGYRIFKQPLADDDVDLELKTTEMTDREAFFSAMAVRMMQLSKKYNRKLEDLHDIFYTVSCDFERLEQVLQQVDGLTWTVLEDLAVRDERDSEAYKHVVEQKTLEQVEKRR